jgi:DNA (cytosine-5)-methyltransferase 1
VTRPLILDGFCGVGLVHDGLCAAGWQPVGVDIEPQPDYPGPFIQADVLAMDERFYRMFEALWFSPPCLKDTELAESARREQRQHGKAENEHPDLITPTQRLVDRLGKPYVIENVRNCRILRNPVVLCGSMFDLGADDGGRRFHLERHRKFETNWGLAAPKPCRHLKPCVGVYGGHARVRAASAGGRGTKEPWTRAGVDIMHEAMGMQRRVTVETISQGIPPSYARYVGEQLLDHMEMERWAA